MFCFSCLKNFVVDWEYIKQEMFKFSTGLVDKQNIEKIKNIYSVVDSE